jgi:hypothetical protein
MTFYFNKVGWPEGAPSDEAGRKELVAGLHKRKTDLFMDLVEKGSLPLRPGVARLGIAFSRILKMHSQLSVRLEKGMVIIGRFFCLRLWQQTLWLSSNLMSELCARITEKMIPLVELFLQL